MDTLHLAPQRPRRRPPRRDPASVPDSDATLVIDVLYLSHLNRQAMLDAQASLRGDDSGAQVW